MVKVTDIVKEILQSSEPELTALSRRVLNLSAYAKRIQPEVQRRTHKTVRLGTIVVALSRLASEIEGDDPLLPKVELESIAVKSNLSEIAYNKTAENKARAQKLYSEKSFAQADFLTVTHGVSEISIFVQDRYVDRVRQAFRPEEPKLYLDNLAGLTVQFGKQYIHTPSMYFALMRTMAVKRINIVELISTYTELTFLVAQEDLNQIFVLMNSMMKQRKK